METVFLTTEKINNRSLDHVYGCSYSLYPIPDLATLLPAAVLKKEGIKVSLFRLSNKKDLKKIPKADNYFIHSVILSHNFDLKIGKRLQNERVFYFGPFATLFPDRYLNFGDHYVLRGETERNIVKAIIDPQKTEGISFRRNNKIIHNRTDIIKNLDFLPFPARELDNREYFNPKLNFKKYTCLLSSRGCVSRCYFCVPNSISWSRELEWRKNKKGKPPVTIRSAENVIREVKIIHAQGYKEFSFVDDQFILGKERTIKILKAIKKLKMPFGILARADRLIDRQIVRALAEAGCVYVDIGVESFDQEILDEIKKDISLSKIFKAIENLVSVGIDPKLNIIFGLSEKETKKKIKKTIKQALELPINSCMFSIATPYPGTQFANIARKKKWIKDKQEINPLKVAKINYPELKTKEIESLTRKANRQFYLRRKIIWQHLKKIKSFSTSKKAAIFFINLIKNLQ